MFALDFHHMLGYCHLVFCAIQERLGERFLVQKWNEEEKLFDNEQAVY
jgi:hypothetical protein